MNIKFFDKNLLERFLKPLGIIEILFSFAITIIGSFDFPWFVPVISLSVCIAVIIVSYLVMFFKAKKSDCITLKINNTEVNVKFGNLDDIKDGLIEVNFNEYFDVLVDNIVIAENSRNGTFIKEHINDIKAFEKTLNKSLLQKTNRIKKENCIRKNGGHTTKYELGTTVIYNGKYALVAFTSFDEEDHNNVTSEEYACCLLRMWNELNKEYNLRPLYLPLCGTGIARIDGTSISPQDALEAMLSTFKLSKMSFASPSSLNIILLPKIKKEINFERLRIFEKGE